MSNYKLIVEAFDRQTALLRENQKTMSNNNKT